MVISKETMEKNALSFMNSLFSLKEIDKVAIKDIVITSPWDYENIRKGLDLCYHDKLSDVDFNIWLKLSAEDFHGETPIYKKYFRRLGIENDIFGVLFQERMDVETNKEGLRICLTSGFRMDLTCFTRYDEHVKSLPKTDLRINNPIKQPHNYWADWDLDKANAFWFNSILALAKLIRRDYLISDHLTHMLLMEGLVLQMIKRDNLYQSNFHRHGYAESLDYRTVDCSNYISYLDSQDSTYNHIASNLISAVICYDNSVAELNPLYHKRSNLFFEIWKAYL